MHFSVNERLFFIIKEKRNSISTCPLFQTNICVFQEKRNPAEYVGTDRNRA